MHVRVSVTTVRVRVDTWNIHRDGPDAILTISGTISGEAPAFDPAAALDDARVLIARGNSDGGDACSSG